MQRKTGRVWLGLKVPDELKSKLGDRAWQERASLSALVRRVLTDYLKTPPPGAPKPPMAA